MELIFLRIFPEIVLILKTIFKEPVKIGDGKKNITISYVDGNPRVLGPGVEYKKF